MPARQPTARYIVHLDAPVTPDDPDGSRRLRRWLKASWRGYRLRCRRVTPDLEPTTHGKPR